MLRSIFIIVSFIVILFLPGIQYVTHILPDSLLNENRLLKPMPIWKNSKKQINNYLLSWQDWFNDHYPTRNLLIRIKNQIDYSIFSYSDRIYIGLNGWLFYRQVLDDQIRSDAMMRQEEIDACVDQFKKLNKYLENKGIKLVIIENQMKYVFYSDELPSDAPRSLDFKNYNILRKRLKEDVGAVWIDTTILLKHIKLTREVFHRTDFHWNDPAAFEVAKETVNKLCIINKKPNMGWRFVLNIEKRKSSGGEASFMPLLKPISEDALFVKKTWNDRPAIYTMNIFPYEFIQRYNEQSSNLLPGVVVFGDSFFDGMIRSGFCEHFTSIHRARLYKVRLKDVLLNLPKDTRFMIVEFIEPSVNLFATPIDYTAL